jgi:hypothetical protein
VVWCAFHVPILHGLESASLACLANFETLIVAAAYAAPAVRRQTIKTKTIPENPKRPFLAPESCPFANCECRQCSVVRHVSTRRVSSFLKLRVVQPLNLAVSSMPYRATTLRACPRHCIGHTQYIQASARWFVFAGRTYTCTSADQYQSLFSS